MSAWFWEKSCWKRPTGVFWSESLKKSKQLEDCWKQTVERNKILTSKWAIHTIVAFTGIFHCLSTIVSFIPFEKVKKIKFEVTTHMAPKSKTRLSISNPVLLAVLAVWSLREPHLPWSTIEPNSTSKGIQPVLSHHSKRGIKGWKKNPALFEHPLNGLPAPTSQTWTLLTHTCILSQTHTQSSSLIHTCPHTNTLSKHTHTCPDNSRFSVAHSHRQTMSSSPLSVHPSPHFTSPPTSSAPLPFFFVVRAVIEEFLPCYRRRWDSAPRWRQCIPTAQLNSHSSQPRPVFIWRSDRTGSM